MNLTGIRPGRRKKLVTAWIPLTFAINGVNREYGPAGPLSLRPVAARYEKLQYVQDLIHGLTTRDDGTQATVVGANSTSGQILRS